MQQASTGFKDALRFGSYLYEAQITVYSGGNPTSYVVPVSDASISVSRSAAQRRSGSVTFELLPTVPPQVIMPVSTASPLAPFGNEVYIQVRATVAGATPNEWIPLGLFSLATTTVQDSTLDLTVTADIYDRSWVISQAQFIEPYNVPATTGNFVDEIVHLLDSVWSRAAPTALPLQYNITPTDATVPTNAYNQGADPWQAAMQMAAAAGYELFFDANGVVTGYPIPDPATQLTVWVFAEDGTTGLTTGGLSPNGEQLGSSPYTVPASTTVTFTRDRIFNDVIVTGTGTQNAPTSASGLSEPIVARAQDTNPQSPTYVSGPVGDIPEFIQSNMITSSAQAQAMADNELQAALAMVYQIAVDTPPNPLLDVDDVCAVYRSRMGLNGTRFVIDSATLTVRYDALCTFSGRVVA